MNGFSKLADSTRIAKEAGFEYIWIDTCCIDKSSSAELSEAINSMFKWYQNSSLCLAYLSDVSLSDLVTESMWFMRGWTLQELIAPRELRFYNKYWEPVGTKKSLSDELGERTGIPPQVLSGEKDVRVMPVCCKMAWAASRVTTRPEDLAYCLMGLFDVNMPLLYGEGAEKSFRRLQEMIVKQTDDESIFAWSASSEEVEKRPFWGLFAPSPAYFKDSSEYTIPQFKAWRDGNPVEMTNKGLRVSFTLYPCPGDDSKTQFLAVLNCSRQRNLDDELSGAFVIILQKLSDFEDQYARIVPDRGLHIKEYLDDDVFLDLLKISQIFVRSDPAPTDPVLGFCIDQTNQVAFEFPTNSMNGPQILDGTTEMWCENSEGWQLRNMSTARKLFFNELNKSKPPLDPSRFGVSNLMQRQLVGGIRVKFQSHIKGKGHPPFSHRINASDKYEDPFLLVGFEPLQKAAISTPPGFVRPWYSFAPSMDQQAVSKILSGESPLQSTHTPPGNYKAKIQFTATSYRFRTFYKMKVSNAEKIGSS